MNAKAKSIPEKIVDAALKRASEMSWEYITLSDIAKEANVEMADFRDFFEDKTDILVAYGRRVDRKVLANVKTVNMDESEKDRLFEALMERFDIINEDRIAVISILKSMKSDPKALLISAPHLKHSMAWMMEAAGIQSHGWKGAGQLVALTLTYLNVVRTWKSDETEDMAKTMAALDKGLARYEKLCSSVAGLF